MADMDLSTEVENPFARQQSQQVQVLTGLVSVEQQRVVAEIQARMIIARANPRDPIRAWDAIMRDCTRPTLAMQAVYTYERGKQEISGPSIRLMESIARNWGNIASGIKEISRNVDVGYSECIAYAWDLETGFYDERQFQVRHWRDTREGGYRLKDERDIYELVANMGQRRKRACLIAAIPGDVVDAAVTQCEQTLNTNVDMSPAAIARMVTAFGEFGVTRQQLEKRCARRIESLAPAQVVQLRKIYASLKDEMSEAKDWFPSETDGVWSDLDQREQQAPRKQAARKQAATKPETEKPKTETERQQTTTQGAQREGAPTPVNVPVTPEPPPPVAEKEQESESSTRSERTAHAQDARFEAWLADDTGDLSSDHPDMFTDPVKFLLALEASMRKPGAIRENIWENNRDPAEQAAAASEEAAKMLEEMERAASEPPPAEEIHPLAVQVDRNSRPVWPPYIKALTDRLAAATAHNYLDIISVEMPTIERTQGSSRVGVIKIAAATAERLGVPVPELFRNLPDAAAQQCDGFCKDIEGAESEGRLDEIMQNQVVVRRHQAWKTERPELAEKMDKSYEATRARLRGAR